jgi:hypothetical protein
MQVGIAPDIVIEADFGEGLYTLRDVNKASRYEFCAEHELVETIAIMFDLSLGDPMTRRRVQVAAESIVNAAQSTAT